MSAKKTRKSTRSSHRAPQSAEESEGNKPKNPSYPPSDPPYAGKKRKAPSRVPSRTPRTSSRRRSVRTPEADYGESIITQNQIRNLRQTPDLIETLNNSFFQNISSGDLSFAEFTNIRSAIQSRLDSINNSVEIIKASENRLQGEFPEQEMKNMMPRRLIQQQIPNENNDLLSLRGQVVPPPINTNVSRKGKYQGGVKNPSNNKEKRPMLIQLSPATPMPANPFPSTKKRTPTNNISENGGSNLSVIAPPHVDTQDKPKLPTPTTSTNGLNIPRPVKRKRDDKTMKEAPISKKRKVSRVPSAPRSLPQAPKPPSPPIDESIPPKKTDNNTTKKKSNRKNKKFVSSRSPPKRRLSDTPVFNDDEEDFYREDEEKVSLTTSVQFWKYVDSFYEPLDSEDKLKELDPSPNHFHKRMSTRIFQQTMFGTTNTNVQKPGNQKSSSSTKSKKKTTSSTSKKGRPSLQQQQEQQLLLNTMDLGGGENEGILLNESFDPLGDIPGIGEHYSLGWAREDVANDEIIDGDHLDDSWSTMPTITSTSNITSHHHHHHRHRHHGGGGHHHNPHHINQRYQSPNRSNTTYQPSSHHHHSRHHHGRQTQHHRGNQQQQQQQQQQYHHNRNQQQIHQGQYYPQQPGVMPYATRSRRRTDDSSSSSSHHHHHHHSSSNSSSSSFFSEQKIIEVPSTSKVFEDNSLTMRLMNSLIEEKKLPRFSSNHIANLNPSNYMMLQLQSSYGGGKGGIGGKDQKGNKTSSSSSSSSSSGGTKRTISAKRKKLMKDVFFQQITNNSKALVKNIDPKQVQQIQKNLKFSVKEYTAENIYKFDGHIESQLRDLGIWDVDHKKKKKKKKKKRRKKKRIGDDEDEDIDDDEEEDLTEEEEEEEFNDEICVKIRELQQQLRDQYKETNKQKETLRGKVISRIPLEKEFRNREDEFEMIKKEYEKMFNKRKRSHR